MTDDAPLRLLARERAALDDIARVVRDGQRMLVFVVAEPPARSVALAYLRDHGGLALGNTVSLDDPGQTLDVLQALEKASPRDVWSLIVVHSAPHVVETLNWHREKMTRGASVLLWIDGIEGFRFVRQTAPDAYSFRSTTVFLEGETPTVIVPAAEESVDVQLARLRYSAATTVIERAEAAAHLVGMLTARGILDEGRTIIDRALGELVQETNQPERLRIVTAVLYQQRGSTSDQGTSQYRWRKRALAQLDGLTSPHADYFRLVILSELKTPCGPEHGSLQQAENLLQHLQREGSGIPAVTRSSLYLGLGESWMTRGNMAAAHSYFREALSLVPLRLANRECALVADGYLELNRGLLANAAKRFEEALALCDEAGLPSGNGIRGKAGVLYVMGEHDAARRIFMATSGMAPQEKPDVLDDYDLLITLALGERAHAEDLHATITRFHSVFQYAEKHAMDGMLFRTSDTYADLLESTYTLDNHGPERVAKALADIAVSEAIAVDIAQHDPAWYEILFPAIRARLYALSPERLPEAITLVTHALERARTEFADAVHPLTRQLCHHLISAKRFDDAHRELDKATALAREDQHLRILARLQAYSVVTLVHKNAPRTNIDAAMDELRKTFDAMDAPWITADTLLELAQLLPPSCKRPDPHDLADEAATLYGDMPYPAQESRALEVMGDVLAARGDEEHALRCYQESRSIYERFGLRLRLPRLLKKNAASLMNS